MFYIIVSTNLSSLFFFFFFLCSVQWHFMLKQWEPPPSTIFSSATNYFDGGWPPLLQGVSWWYFSFYTHTYIHIVWSSEQQREHEPVFDSHNWLGQMSTFSFVVPYYSRVDHSMLIYICVCVYRFKLVRPHVHVWCHCLYCRFFFFSPSFTTVVSVTADDLHHKRILLYFFSILNSKLLYIPFSDEYWMDREARGTY